MKSLIHSKNVPRFQHLANTQNIEPGLLQFKLSLYIQQLILTLFLKACFFSQGPGRSKSSPCAAKHVYLSLSLPS